MIEKLFTDALAALVALANLPMILLTFVLTSLLKPVMVSKPGVAPRWYQRPFEDPDNYVFFVIGMGVLIGAITEFGTPNIRIDQLFTKVMLAGCAPAVLFKLGKQVLPTWLQFLLGEHRPEPGEPQPTGVVSDHAKQVVVAYQKGEDVAAAINKLEAVTTTVTPPSPPTV